MTNFIGQTLEGLSNAWAKLVGPSCKNSKIEEIIVLTN